MTEFKEGKPCRTCQGTKRYMTGQCVICQNRHRKQYQQNNFTFFSGIATPADTGQAGEHLVAADLLRRGLQGTKPLNTNGPHDLHFKFSSGWKTIQVKLGKVSKRTGTLYPNNWKRSIVSDIFAVVDLAGMRVRYISNDSALPPELLE